MPRKNWGGRGGGKNTTTGREGMGEKKIKRNKRAEREKERVSNKQARRRLTPQWEVLHMKNRK